MSHVIAVRLSDVDYETLLEHAKGRGVSQIEAAGVLLTRALIELRLAKRKPAPVSAPGMDAVTGDGRGVQAVWPDVLIEDLKEDPVEP